MSAPRFVSVRVTIIGIDLIKSNSILWGKKLYVLLNKSLLDTWMDPQVGDASGFLVFTSSHNLDSPKCTQFENRNISGPKVDLEDSHSDTCVGCTKLQLNLKTQNPTSQLPFFPPF